MSMSRRSAIASALAATAAIGGLGAAQQAGAASAPRRKSAFGPAASPVGDVVGKITVGYQGWFACIGDGAPINSWWHYSANGGQPPSPSNTTLVSWPETKEYSKTYRTAYPNLNSGQPATLFSSWDQQTVDTHFRWMQENGCDTAALQRFNPFGAEGPTRDGMAQKVRQAAEAHGRKFYIMYDVSGWTSMQSQIKDDWTSKMKAYTASGAYAKQNGKPVVCIWGFGFSDSGRPFEPAPCLDVVNWFKSQGCYVIGGVPTHWRTGTDDSRAGFSDVYHAFNMISPWMVGRISNVSQADQFARDLNGPDQADCDAHGIDYQPCVIPGDLQGRARAHGDLMWRQFYNLTGIGAQGFYISMFDEFNEGNQIAKTAETAADVPAGSGIFALDEDGTSCSSDYYLRLTNDGGRMLKGQLARTPNRPTQPRV
ncbi:xylosidase [Streptomyces sp. AcH 505]|uniref:glycoside hydrolase family 71/99-like protein n=1 Tax=Streptomyces sp. AcH 505 TaxID=352211 RepID=UPI000591BE58|nr:xylosidase [Streptomyces sp. AcH 505]